MTQSIIRDERLFRLPDPEIVAKAAGEQRIVLTFDLDSETFSLPPVSRPQAL